MRAIIFYLFLLQSSFVFSQTQAKTDEIQVQELIQNMFEEFFSNYNSEKIPEYQTPDFILLEDGMIWDNQIIAKYLDEAKAKGDLPTRTNRFEFIETKVFGDRAWVAYKNWATLTKDGKVIREMHWFESAVAVKTPSGWKLEMMHSTPVEMETK